jgi:DNA helicase-2/ATP-dependent DNA helicase PcrA
MNKVNPAQSKFEERYGKLNKQQKKAVDTIDGPLLVVAGPGSGKTEILSLRVAKILKETQVLPSNILCMTFTDAASSNMRDRLSRLIGNEAYRVSIHTFHSFCINIIQKYPEYFYKGIQFTPADSLTQVRILEDIFYGLPQGNTFRDSYHEEKGFSYLSDAKKRIEHLKKSGITPDEFRKIIAHNKRSARRAEKIVVPAFEGRLGKDALELVKNTVAELFKAAELENKEDPFPQENSIFLPILASYANSLQGTHADAIADDGKNTQISTWKTKYLKMRDDGTKTLKEILDEDKMDVLADVYDLYRKKMTSKAFFDFDDMILDAIEAIEKHPRLKFELQEQYQYVLVDEFQDTNNAQMKLVNLILNAPVNEGRPNVMVVGDDDQAVYKFQGAELSNILNFRRMFVDVEIVTMTDNYRSTQDVLDIATHIIRKGSGRLETLYKIEKSLKSLGEGLTNGEIVNKKFRTSLEEYHFISRKIKELIDGGTNPEDIAVIARKHDGLESLVPYLKGVHVPIRYKREQDVFLEPHIMQIIIISRFIASLSRKDAIEADNYLPQILSFPFWQLGRQTVWEISKEAYETRKTWLEVMLEYKGDSIKAPHKVSDIAHFLIDIANKSLHEPLEKVLDIIIGAHVVLVAESEDDFEDDGVGAAGPAVPAGAKAQIASPFKDYYFNKEKFEHSRTEYLSFLSSLRVFIRALRDYVGERALNDDTILSGDLNDVSYHYLTIEDLIKFVDLRQKNHLPLNDESPFASGEKAVNLLSSHGAKGLEFDTVFVLSCQDNIWAGRGVNNKISFPINLPIQPAGDDETDQMRLFYVALTRAKRHLYLTSYKIAETGKESSILRFMLPSNDFDYKKSPAVLEKLYNPEDQSIDDNGPETHELLTASWLLYNTPPFFGEEIELLKIPLKDYKLSVTHLNNFLDVKRGGPQTFLEQNLLRFPQAKTLVSSYGSTIHKAIERLIVSKKIGKDVGELDEEGNIVSFSDSLPDLDDVKSVDKSNKHSEKQKLIKWFETALRKERMSSRDYEYYRQKGEESLSAFYDQKSEDFTGDDLSEVDFRNEGVVITDEQNRMAHLTGKIDKIFKNQNHEYEVVDFKTGKAEFSWQSSDEDKKIKLNNYRRQLVFYKLLMENSARYKNSKVSKGLLQFVEPIKETTEKGTMKNKIIGLDLDLKNLNDEELGDEYERLKKLVCIVYDKIMNLDFPDVTSYDPSLKGIRAFEDWLLEGN